MRGVPRDLIKFPSYQSTLDAMNANRNFFLNLSSTNVRYVIWKNIAEVNDDTFGLTDIDIYIHQDDEIKFQQFLRDYPYVEAYYSHAEFEFVRHVFVLSYPEKPLHLHIYNRLVTGHTWLKEYDITSIFPNIFRDRQIINGMFFASNKDLNDLHHIRLSLKQRRFLNRIYFNKHKKEYLRESLNLEASFASEISSMKDIDFRHYERFGVFSYSYRYIVALVKRITYKTVGFEKRRFNRPAIISICGVDGVGKSTIVRCVADYMMDIGRVKTLSLGRITSPNSRSSATALSAQRSGIEHSLKGLVLSAVRFYRANFIARLYMSRGYLIVTDRWPGQVPGLMDSPRRYSASSRLTHLINHLEYALYSRIRCTDLAIMLNVSLEEALRRNRNREKNLKETDEEIRIRFSSNTSFKPKAHRLVLFDNSDTLAKSLQKIFLIISSLNY